MEFFIKFMLFAALYDHKVSSWFICQQCDCKVKSFDCTYRGFKEFPQYFPYHIEYLNLTGNELHNLPDTVYNLHALAYLNLACNQLSYIPATTLKHLWSLELLDLSRNKLNSLSDVHGIIYSYKLKELILRNNPIKDSGKCDQKNALNSQSVNKLDLSQCILTNINPCAFSWMTNLTHLHLSGNPLKELKGIISETLQHLEVSKCEINFINEEAFAKLPALKYLDISKNPNLRVHTQFNEAYLSLSLTELDASECGLTELFTSVFPNLNYASFKSNFIRELPPRLLYYNQELISIDLSENLISLIHHGTFIGAYSITNLDLSLNFITEIQPGTFSHMYKLNKLNLSHNPLKTLSNINSFSLDNLDVSDCDITELNPTTVFGIPNLSTLNVSNNPIEYLSNELYFINLEELDISYCRIIMLNQRTFEGMPKLKKLDLRGNRLTNLFPLPAMQSMQNIREILITNNPWQCRCNSTEHKEFLSFIENRSPEIHQQGLTCLMPDSQLQISWIKACQITSTQEVRRFKTEKHWTAFFVIFAIMFSVLIVMLILRHNFSVSPVTNTTQEHIETIETNTTPYPVRSPIADILQLPTYEEAILLPKPTHSTSSDKTREVGTSIQSFNIEENENANNGSDDDGNGNNIHENSSLFQYCVSVNVSSTSL